MFCNRIVVFQFITFVLLAIRADCGETGVVAEQPINEARLISRLEEELEVAKFDVEKIRTEFTNYRRAQREAFSKFAVGLRLGNLEVKNETLKGVVVTSFADETLKVIHDGGIASIPLSELTGDVRLLFGVEDTSTLSVEVEKGDSEIGISAQSSTITSRDNFNEDSLIIIRTDVGSGSGFIMKTPEGVFVYTNAHVICGDAGAFTKKIISVTTASGKNLLLPTHIELSDDYNPDQKNGLEDLARFRVEDNNLVAYEVVSQNEGIQIGDQLVAYGNSHGQGVITKLNGEVLGIAADRMEISCEIVQGNSGGPVISASTGKIVGVSTYANTRETDIWSKGTRFSEVRRFAVRPEKVSKWRRMEISGLLSRMAEIERYNYDTRMLFAASYLELKPNRAGFTFPDRSLGEFNLKDLITTPTSSNLSQVITVGISRVNSKLGNMASNISYAGAAPIYAEFYIGVKKSSVLQTQTFSQTMAAPYIKQFLSDYIEMRRKADDFFAESAINMAENLKK